MSGSASHDVMKRVLSGTGILLILIGTVWFLQGINVLPGSYMSGQTRWAVNGGILAAAGLALFVTSRRRA